MTDVFESMGFIGSKETVEKAKEVLTEIAKQESAALWVGDVDTGPITVITDNGRAFKWDGKLQIMTTLKLVNLMMRSSDNNPYTGKLSKKENTLAAIELAKLCKNFADTGQTDEAMNIESSQWVEVIGRLEGKLLKNQT